MRVRLRSESASGRVLSAETRRTLGNPFRWITRPKGRGSVRVRIDHSEMQKLQMKVDSWSSGPIRTQAVECPTRT